MIVDVSALLFCAQEKLGTLNDCTQDKGIVRRLLLKNLVRKWWYLNGYVFKEEVSERPPPKRQRDSDDEHPEPAKRPKLVCQPVQAPVQQGAANAAEEPQVEEAALPHQDEYCPNEGAPLPVLFDIDDILEELERKPAEVDEAVQPNENGVCPIEGVEFPVLCDFDDLPKDLLGKSELEEAAQPKPDGDCPIEVASLPVLLDFNDVLEEPVENPEVEEAAKPNEYADCPFDGVPLPVMFDFDDLLE